MKLICLDCDSTLSAIEGVDELARLRGPDVFANVEAMTRDAMEGRIRVEDAFAGRMEIIRPRTEDAAAVGRLYLETIEPTAVRTVAELMRRGWTPAIISGGFRQAIRPLAAKLGIARLEAVDLIFAADGAYRGFDTAFPTTRSGGKSEIVRKLRAELAPERTVMVGDGATDLETKPHVDLFVGFGRYTTRENVRREAELFITSLDQLLDTI